MVFCEECKFVLRNQYSSRIPDVYGHNILISHQNQAKSRSWKFYWKILLFKIFLDLGTYAVDIRVFEWIWAVFKQTLNLLWHIFCYFVAIYSMSIHNTEIRNLFIPKAKVHFSSAISVHIRFIWFDGNKSFYWNPWIR